MLLYPQPFQLIDCVPFRRARVVHTGHMILKRLISLTQLPITHQLLSYHLHIKLLNSHPEVFHQLTVLLQPQPHFLLKGSMMHLLPCFNVKIDEFTELETVDPYLFAHRLREEIDI